MRLLLVFLISLLVSPAFAQSATVAVFPASATDPNMATPLATPVVYTPLCGQLPKLVEVPPIVNPNIGAYDDPADAARDCRLNVAPQFAAIAPGSGYKAAVKLGAGVYGAFSTAFAVQPPAHPCDTTPTSRTTALVGQSVTVAYCHPLLDINNNPVVVSSFRLYRNGTLLAVTPVVGTPSPTGWVLASVTRVESLAGTSTYEMAAVNNLGVESARSTALAVVVTQPTAAPVAPSRGRVQ